MYRKFILILVIFLFAFLGCAPQLIKTAPPDTNIASLGENILVFGRINWFENGEEKKRSVTLKALRAEDMRKGALKVEKDGSFFALIPRGTYILYQIDWRDPWDGTHWLIPKASFRIADVQQACYLGTLVVDLKAKRDILGSLWVKAVTIGIEDKENEAMEALRNRYPDQEINVAKALIIHDPSIPGIEALENKSLLFDVLHSLYFGVMPMLSP